MRFLKFIKRSICLTLAGSLVLTLQPSSAWSLPSPISHQTYFQNQALVPVRSGYRTTPVAMSIGRIFSSQKLRDNLRHIDLVAATGVASAHFFYDIGNHLSFGIASTAAGVVGVSFWAGLQTGKLINEMGHVLLSRRMGLKAEVVDLTTQEPTTFTSMFVGFVRLLNLRTLVPEQRATENGEQIGEDVLKRDRQIRRQGYWLGVVGLGAVGIAAVAFLPVIAAFSLIGGLSMAGFVGLYSDILRREQVVGQFDCGLAGSGMTVQPGVEMRITDTLSKEFVMELRDELEVVMERGNQQLGIAIPVMLRGRETFLYVKYTKARREEPVDALLDRTIRELQRAAKSGQFKFIEGEGPLLISHSRFATGSPATEDEYAQPFFSFEPGRLFDHFMGVRSTGEIIKVARHMDIGLEHNGDNNYYTTPWGQELDTAGIQEWMRNVYATPAIVPGDTPQIPAQLSLLRAQGDVYAALRYAYIMTQAHKIDDVMDSDTLDRWVLVVAPALEGWLQTTYPTGLAKLGDVDQTQRLKAQQVLKELLTNSEAALLPNLNDAPSPKPTPKDEALKKLNLKLKTMLGDDASVDRFANSFVEGFFYNDMTQAIKIFAKQSRGTYGLSIKSLVDPGIHFYSHWQRIALAIDAMGRRFSWNSEPKALAIQKPDASGKMTWRYKKRFGFNMLAKEVGHFAPDGTLRVWSLTDPDHPVEINTDKRWFDMTVSRFVRPLKKYGRLTDPVKSNLVETSDTAHDVEKEWADPTSNNNRVLASMSDVMLRFADMEQEGRLPSGIHILIYGLGAAADLGEAWARSLKTRYPGLEIEFIDTNTNLLDTDALEKRISANTMAIGLSLSGESTTNALTALLARRVQNVFAVTGGESGDLDNQMAETLGQEYPEGSPNARRTIKTGRRRADAEAMSVDMTAMGLTLAHVDNGLAAALRRKHPTGDVLGLDLDAHHIEELQRQLFDLPSSFEHIVGTVAPPVQTQLEEAGKHYGNHSLEGLVARWFFRVFLVVSLSGEALFKWTPDRLIPGLHLHPGIHGAVPLLSAVAVVFIQTAYFLGFNYLFILALRKAQKRILTDRFVGTLNLIIAHSNRSAVLVENADKQIGHSFGINGWINRGGNPLRELLLKMQANARRGTKFSLSGADTRLPYISSINDALGQFATQTKSITSLPYSGFFKRAKKILKRIRLYPTPSGPEIIFITRKGGQPNKNAEDVRIELETWTFPVARQVREFNSILRNTYHITLSLDQLAELHKMVPTLPALLVGEGDVSPMKKLGNEIALKLHMDPNDVVNFVTAFENQGEALFPRIPAVVALNDVVTRVTNEQLTLPQRMRLFMSLKELPRLVREAHRRSIVRQIGETAFQLTNGRLDNFEHEFGNFEDSLSIPVQLTQAEHQFEINQGFTFTDLQRRRFRVVLGKLGAQTLDGNWFEQATGVGELLGLTRDQLWNFRTTFETHGYEAIKVYQRLHDLNRRLIRASVVPETEPITIDTLEGLLTEHGRQEMVSNALQTVIDKLTVDAHISNDSVPAFKQGFHAIAEKFFPLTMNRKELTRQLLLRFASRLNDEQRKQLPILIDSLPKPLEQMHLMLLAYQVGRSLGPETGVLDTFMDDFQTIGNRLIDAGITREERAQRSMETWFFNWIITAETEVANYVLLTAMADRNRTSPFGKRYDNRAAQSNLNRPTTASPVSADGATAAMLDPITLKEISEPLTEEASARISRFPMESPSNPSGTSYVYEVSLGASKSEESDEEIKTGFSIQSPLLKIDDMRNSGALKFNFWHAIRPIDRNKDATVTVTLTYNGGEVSQVYNLRDISSWEWTQQQIDVRSIFPKLESHPNDIKITFLTENATGTMRFESTIVGNHAPEREVHIKRAPASARVRPLVNTVPQEPIPAQNPAANVIPNASMPQNATPVLTTEVTYRAPSRLENLLENFDDEEGHSGNIGTSFIFIRGGKNGGKNVGGEFMLLPNSGLPPVPDDFPPEHREAYHQWSKILKPYPRNLYRASDQNPYLSFRTGGKRSGYYIHGNAEHPDNYFLLSIELGAAMAREEQGDPAYLGAKTVASAVWREESVHHLLMLTPEAANLTPLQIEHDANLAFIIKILKSDNPDEAVNFLTHAGNEFDTEGYGQKFILPALTAYREYLQHHADPTDQDRKDALDHALGIIEKPLASHLEQHMVKKKVPAVDNAAVVVNTVQPTTEAQETAAVLAPVDSTAKPVGSRIRLRLAPPRWLGAAIGVGFVLGLMLVGQHFQIWHHGFEWALQAWNHWHVLHPAVVHTETVARTLQHALPSQDLSGHALQTAKAASATLMDNHHVAVSHHDIVRQATTIPHAVSGRLFGPPATTQSAPVAHSLANSAHHAASHISPSIVHRAAPHAATIQRHVEHTVQIVRDALPNNAKVTADVEHYKQVFAGNTQLMPSGKALVIKGDHLTVRQAVVEFLHRAYGTGYASWHPGDVEKTIKMVKDLNNGATVSDSYVLPVYSPLKQAIFSRAGSAIAGSALHTIGAVSPAPLSGSAVHLGLSLLVFPFGLGRLKSSAVTITNFFSRLTGWMKSGQEWKKKFGEAA